MTILISSCFKFAKDNITSKFYTDKAYSYPIQQNKPLNHPSFQSELKYISTIKLYTQSEQNQETKRTRNQVKNSILSSEGTLLAKGEPKGPIFNLTIV